MIQFLERYVVKFFTPMKIDDLLKIILRISAIYTLGVTVLFITKRFNLHLQKIKLNLNYGGHCEVVCVVIFFKKFTPILDIL